ncbi:lactoylglutathione lyase [[Candida] railenensis]|uniref:Lactoylglutathione lyase n=1 Tax=[Candida] railenensis TaxID=45579 RepID=A0A9P0VXZ6_9ASCO|nr:lactoylglutathione lyase [[Candida] railenensis]
MPSFDNSFVVNHTCLRIKDPKVSIPFYVDNFGFKVVATFPFPEKKFTLYMLGYEHDQETSHKNWSAREGILELCHNHGVEDDDSYTLNNGNGAEHRGFGHICISVDNINVVEERLLASNAKFQKKLSDGRQKDIAFVLDPNGYWIELIQHGKGKVDILTDQATYLFNHTMIRVKDPVKSLEFYKNVLGMKVFRKHDHENAKFSLYFIGYDHDSNFKEDSVDRDTSSLKQGIIELTHNWGTESDPEFKGYHNGNSTEGGAKQGFGHTCISCKDPAKFCKEVEEEFPDSTDWSVKWNQGGMKNIAFIRDPDGYSIEIISHELFKDGN